MTSIFLETAYAATLEEFRGQVSALPCHQSMSLDIDMKMVGSLNLAG